MTQLFGISAHLFAYERLALEHLEAAASAGFGQVELWSMTPHFDAADAAARARLREWLAALSLEAATVHLPFYRDLEEAYAGTWLSFAHPDADHRAEAVRRAEAAMEAFAEFGARIAVLHPSAPGEAGDADTRDGLRESVERLLPRAEKLDLCLAVENIPSALGRTDAVANFVETIDHPRVGACLDCGHAHVTEHDRFGEALRRLAPLTLTTHLHDNDGVKDAHLLPGEGALPCTILWGELDRAGYAGPLMFEVRRREGESYAGTLAALTKACRMFPMENPA